MILENVGSVAGKDFFICGPAAFMKAMENNLLSLGVTHQKIHQEAFSVTPNLSFRKNFKNIFLVYGLTIALFLFFLNFVKASATVSYKSAPADVIETAVPTSTKINLPSKKVDSRITVPRTNTTRKVVPVVTTPKIITPKAVIPAVVNPTAAVPTIVTPQVSQPIYTPAPAPTPRTRVS